MATNAKKEITPERKEYKRQWMAAFLAKQREPKASNDGNGQRTQFQQANAEHIAALERELRDLKAEVGLTLTIEPTPQDRRDNRIAAFEEQLKDLHNYSTIPTLKAKVTEAQAEFEAIRQGGEWFNQHNDRTQILRQGDRVHELEQRAEYLDKMIVLWSPGGRMRREREALIAEDRTKGTQQRNSSDPHQQRLGIALLKGCDKNEGELEVTLGRLKAELKHLRG